MIYFYFLIISLFCILKYYQFAVNCKLKRGEGRKRERDRKKEGESEGGRGLKVGESVLFTPGRREELNGGTLGPINSD